MLLAFLHTLAADPVEFSFVRPGQLEAFSPMERTSIAPPLSRALHPQDVEVSRAQRGSAIVTTPYPIWLGGSASCLAVLLTHPLDLVKVRMQTTQNLTPKPGIVATCRTVLYSDGFRGLYAGLTGGIARQLLYGTTRFAIYDSLKARLGSEPNPASLAVCASISGFLGAIVGNPADIATVRMQSDTTLPSSARRNYRNVVAAWAQIIRTEGMGALFRGVWVNASRATITTTCQLAAYDSCKHALMKSAALEDNLGTQFLASAAAGLIATTCCSPVDVLRTQIMNIAHPKPLLLVVQGNFAEHGLRWMLRGWVPSFARLGPQTTATFLILEQLRSLYRFVYYPPAC